MCINESEVQAVFFTALEKEPDQRGRYLHEACAGNVKMRRRVENLLDVRPRLGRLLEVEAADLVGVAVQTTSGNRSGTNIGPYKLLREIGRGGMGEVYEAEHATMGRRVALKLLPAISSSDVKVRARFDREVRAAARLQHPHIVSVFEVGEEQNCRFYVIPLIAGQSLDKVLRRLKRVSGQTASDSNLATQRSRDDQPHSDSVEMSLSTARLSLDETDASLCDLDSESDLFGSVCGSTEYFRSVARLGSQVASALSYAHDRGVIHRDIKPSNLLLDTADQVWVTDFGLAHVETDASLTTTGEIMGTLRYMSPEQAGGDRTALDHRTDIYSLGVTLYELITGRRALEGSDRNSLLRAIAERDPPAPRSINRTIPRDLETIVLKAISKEPQTRYATMSEFQVDLDRFLEDAPIRARRASRATRAARWCRRNPLVTTLLTLLLLLAGTTAFILTRSAQVVQLADSAIALREVAKDLSDAYDVSATAITSASSTGTRATWPYWI